ncbi:peptide maturation system acyl carrier-related protein [Clostridioides sp. ZZV14-6345]|uniref:peptide maturation system acyl carrier-related protein n=1 Tax=Clostridioides sp. ZZV14-6345 TaxID=2811496 RepID=UPI001D1126AF
MNKLDIYTVLVNIFEKRSKINFDENCDLKNENLFESKIMMPARELVLTLYDIEDYFSISIPEDVILSGRFNSFNNIYDIVKKLENSINFN